MKISSNNKPNSKGQSSFHFGKRSHQKLEFNRHLHEELELTYIVKGSGVRLVGDNISNYESGDLVFLGSGLPHTWASEYFSGKEEEHQAIVIHIDEKVFAKTIFKLSEFENIKTLFLKAERGIRFFGNTAQVVGNQLIELDNLKNFNKLNKLLYVLDFLQSSDDQEFLTDPVYAFSSGKKIDARIDNICNYIHRNFVKTITLTEIAAIAKMREPSFSRYFKKMIGKPFSDYLMDLRVERACKLLLEENRSIPEIAKKAGFNSLTHFNRTFQKKKKQTPSSYKRTTLKIN